MMKRCRVTRGQVLQTVSHVAVACALLTHATAYADGYNDWNGEVVAPGEFYTVPAISLGRATLSDGTRGFESFPQAQFQVGLFKKVDLILAGASRVNADGALHDWIYIQPRVQLLEGLSFSPGVNLQADAQGDPWALAPGLFHTFSPDGWQVTWNLIAYLTPSDWESSSFFFVTVVEKKINDIWSLYTELDVFHYFSAGAAEASLTAFVGVQWNAGDNDTLNLCLFAPVRPQVDIMGTAVGLWWSHGFEIQPLRRP